MKWLRTLIMSVATMVAAIKLAVDSGASTANPLAWALLASSFVAGLSFSCAIYEYLDSAPKPKVPSERK